MSQSRLSSSSALIRGAKDLIAGFCCDDFAAVGGLARHLRLKFLALIEGPEAVPNSVLDREICADFLPRVRSRVSKVLKHDAEVLKDPEIIQGVEALLELVQMLADKPLAPALPDSVKVFPRFWSLFLAALKPFLVFHETVCDSVPASNVQPVSLSLVTRYLEKLEKTPFGPDHLEPGDVSVIPDVVESLVAVSDHVVNHARHSALLWRTFGCKVIPLLKSRVAEAEGLPLAAVAAKLTAVVSRYLEDVRAAFQERQRAAVDDGDGNGGEAAAKRVANAAKLLRFFLAVLRRLVEACASGVLRFPGPPAAVAATGPGGLVPFAVTVVALRFLEAGAGTPSSATELAAFAGREGYAETVISVVADALVRSGRGGDGFVAAFSKCLDDFVDVGGGKIPATFASDVLTADVMRAAFGHLCLEICAGASTDGDLKVLVVTEDWFPRIFEVVASGLNANIWLGKTPWSSKAAADLCKCALILGSHEYETKLEPFLLKSATFSGPTRRGDASAAAAVLAADVVTRVCRAANDPKLTLSRVAWLLDVADNSDLSSSPALSLALTTLLGNLCALLEPDDAIVFFDSLDGVSAGKLIVFAASLPADALPAPLRVEVAEKAVFQLRDAWAGGDLVRITNCLCCLTAATRAGIDLDMAAVRSVAHGLFLYLERSSGILAYSPSPLVFAGAEFVSSVARKLPKSFVLAIFIRLARLVEGNNSSANAATAAAAIRYFVSIADLVDGSNGEAHLKDPVILDALSCAVELCLGGELLSDLLLLQRSDVSEYLTALTLSTDASKALEKLKDDHDVRALKFLDSVCCLALARESTSVEVDDDQPMAEHGLDDPLPADASWNEALSETLPDVERAVESLLAIVGNRVAGRKTPVSEDNASRIWKLREALGKLSDSILSTTSHE